MIERTLVLIKPDGVERGLIGEIINSPFVLLLVLLSFIMLSYKFIPGALIFAAAALEYGVAKP